MKHNKQLVSTLFISAGLSTALLTGCSSSDDGGGATLPEDAITITADNAFDNLQSGKIALDTSISYVIDASDVLLKSSSQQQRKRHFSDISLDIIKNAKVSGDVATGVSVNETSPCDFGSGSINFTGDYNESATSYNLNGTITFSNCAFSNAVINGSIRTQASESVDANLNYSGSGSDRNGNLTVTINSTAHTVNSYSSNWSYSDATAEDVMSENYSFSSPVIGGGILYNDTSAWKWRYSDWYPYAGTAVITGASNSKMRISAVSSTQFKLEVDADGDGSYEYSQVYNWDAIYATSAVALP